MKVRDASPATRVRDVVLCTGAGAQPPPSSARPCAVACDAHDPPPRRGAAPVPPLGRHADAAALCLGDGDGPAARYADTHVPGPPYCTYGYAHLWHRAARHRDPTHGTYRRTRTSLGRAARTAYRVVHRRLHFPRFALKSIAPEPAAAPVWSVRHWTDASLGNHRARLRLPSQRAEGWHRAVWAVVEWRLPGIEVEARQLQL